MQKVEKPGKQSGAKVGIQLENRVVRKCANLVDLEKYCNVNIVFKKSASIQPRTGRPKFRSPSAVVSAPGRPAVQNFRI